MFTEGNFANCHLVQVILHRSEIHADMAGIDLVCHLLAGRMIRAAVSFQNYARIANDLDVEIVIIHCD